MFAGGIADKLGNRYEAKWLVLQLLGVVGAKYTALTYEGIDPAFNGFEFSLLRDGVTEWHQTKITNPNGNWTLRALEREGVLQAFKRRLSSKNDDLCVFISQDPARDIADLVDKAKIAKSVAEFVDAIGNGTRAKFDEIRTSWAVDDSTAFSWLKRCQFRVESQPSIESMIDSHCELYFDNGSKIGFEILQEFLILHINREITTDTARTEIRNEGKLKFKDHALDTTLEQTLRDKTTEYLNTYIPFGAGHAILTRIESQQLVDRIVNPQGPAVILLTGVAGAGKSGVIRELIGNLSSISITHLSFRVDHHLTCRSAQEFGKEVTGRNESPVVTLKGVSKGQKSVLIVDQVDAVSEVSGRNGAIKHAVLKLVDDARNVGNVVVVISCRTFDLDNDDRLKALREFRGVEHIDVQLLDWESSVKPLLLSKSVDVTNFSASQIQLLRLPLNLALFFETYDPFIPIFGSRNELFRLLLEKKRRAIGLDRTISWDILSPLAQLSTWMSERQRLDAPEAVLSTFGGALNVLPSEGLLVRSRGNVNFFHESFFDYIYALTFSERNITVVELLRQTEQHLFRRTQVRQILESLRQVDNARYLRELRSIIGNPLIRFHIQVTAAQWLGSLNDPTPEERDIILSVDTTEGPIPALVRYVFFGSAGWFDRLHECKWIKAQLHGTTPERSESVLWWLSNMASQRSSEIAPLLDEWWGGEPQRARIMLGWFGLVKRQKPDSGLVDLCVRLIRSNPSGMFEGRGNANRDLLFHTWAEEDPQGAEKILRAYFDTWFEAHPDQHPFEREEFGNLDAHSLEELSKKAPEVFVEGTIGTFIRSVELIASRNEKGVKDYTFFLRFASGHHFGADAFLDMLHRALMEIGRNSPEQVKLILRRIDPNIHQVCAHIWLETIAANGECLNALFVEMLDCEYIFEAGWNGAAWKSFATAARAALPHMTADEIAKFDRVISEYKPELSSASRLHQMIKSEGEEHPWRTRLGVLQYMSRSGYQVWCVLESIGEATLSTASRQLLVQLRRKFANEKPSEPNHLEAHWVQSPIKRENAGRMTDEQWLSAITKYDADEHRRRARSYADGGAEQLAVELQHLAKEQPQRFSKLLEKIPASANRTYISHLLWGLAESKGANLDDLKCAIVAAHQREGQIYGSEISRLIEKSPELAADSAIFAILVWYVENGQANESSDVDRASTEKEVTTIEDLVSQGSRIRISGVNGARGAATEALEHVLWRVPEVIQQTWSVVERRAAIELLVSVRCNLICVALPLYNSDKERCAQLLDLIVSPPKRRHHPSFVERAWVTMAFPSSGIPMFLKATAVWIAYAIERVIRRGAPRADEHAEGYRCAPLVTHHGVRLLPYILRFVPAVGKQLLQRMIAQGDDNTRAVAAWLVFWQSFQNEDFVPLANALKNDGVVYRRLLADVASHAIEGSEFRYRAEAALRVSFSDDDEQVRSQAGDVFRNVKPDQFERYRDLAQDYISSRAFDTGSYGFYHAIKEAECRVDDLIVAATENALKDIEQNGSARGRRMSDLHQLQDILKKEYSASEDEPRLRSRILDLIDKMLKMELYGVDSIVVAHER